PRTPCLLASNLTIRTQIIGAEAADGWFANSEKAPYTLLHPASTNLYVDSHGGLKGVRVIRQGIGAPANLGAVIDATFNFGGVGVTMINGSADTFVENVMIMGFGNCLLSPNGIRASFRRVRGDCTNFFAMTKCDDTCFIDRLEAYPFLAAGQTPQVQSSAVSSVANSGGLINVTLLAAPSYPIKTGYQVKIKGVDGVPANGRWTATRIDRSEER